MQTYWYYHWFGIPSFQPDCVRSLSFWKAPKNCSGFGHFRTDIKKMWREQQNATHWRVRESKLNKELESLHLLNASFILPGLDALLASNCFGGLTTRLYFELQNYLNERSLHQWCSNSENSHGDKTPSIDRGFDVVEFIIGQLFKLNQLNFMKYLEVKFPENS